MTSSPNTFICYATANDKRFHMKDIQNLMRLRSHSTGVGKVILFMAISEVKPPGFWDHLFIKRAKKAFKDHPEIELREIFFKPNAGRDFSSYAELISKVSAEGKPDDFIFLQNRSGLGPYQQNWYQAFVKQYQKFDNVGLCGITINYLDHPDRSDRNNLPHVQTYALLAKLADLDPLTDKFPGGTANSKFEVITQGEIGLSQTLLGQGKYITSLQDPEIAVKLDDQRLNQTDLKNQARQGLPFYHRSFFRKKNKNNRHGLKKIQFSNHLRFFFGV
jgi:hypothetical protein